MANTPISGLNPGGPVADTDLFPDVQTVGVGPVKVTAAQIKTYVNSNPVFTDIAFDNATGTSLSLNTSGSYSTTIESSGSATQSWTFVLPPDDGTNGYILSTDGNGNTTWVNPTVIGIDLDVGSTAITAGTSGRVLYDNAGVLGEYSAVPAGSGGTGNTTNTLHGVLLGNGSSAINATSAGSSGQILQSKGASVDPTWTTATFPATASSTGTILRADGTNWVATTATYPATTTINQILYSSANNQVAGITTGNGGVINTSSAGVPSVTANPVLGVQQTTQGSLVLANTAAGAFSTTVKSSNGATEAWSLTLPVSKGTSGYILTTDGTGVSSWTNPTALGIDIDVNSTSITGGTSGRIVYDNAGTFGEISGITTNGSAALTVGVQQTTQGSLILGNTSAGAFSTTVQSSNSASAAWTLTLPTTAGTANYVLTTNGSGASSWSQVSLTAGVTGILPAANGGTGNSSNTLHGVLLGNAGNAINSTSAGSAGQLLSSGGASADPTWTTATFPSTASSAGTILRADGTNWAASTATYPATTSAGTVLVSSSANAVTGTAAPTLGVAGTTAGTIGLSGATSGVVTIQTASIAGTWSMTLPASGGTNGYILTTDGSGVTSWTNPTALGIDINVNSTAISGGTSGRLVYDNAGTFGEISSITTNGSGSLTVGTQQTTQGSIVLGNTAVGAFETTIQSSNSASAAWTFTLPTTAGTNNYVLTTNGSGTSSWSQVSLTAGVTGILPAANGGTGNSSNTIHGVLIGNAGNAINATAAGSAGQLLSSGGASADPAWTTATFPSTAAGTGTILRADGTNWAATSATYPTTTTAGTLLVSNSANAITASSTPTIGIAGTTAGTIAFANATSGSITLSPTTGALGSSIITMPATTGTMTVLGNSTTGSGNIVLATSPSLTTPSLGAATASSVAINGVTLGTNKLAATGTSYFNGQTFVGETDTAISLAGVSNSYLNIYGTGGGARMSISRFSGNSSGAAIFTGKSRSTSVGSYVAVQSGDTLADFRFAGDDGSNLATYPVQIQAIVTGAVSAGAIPSALTFGTAASGNATERMRIDSAGFVGIGTVPYNILDIYKPQNASSIIRINNDNAGSSASAGITVQSDAGQINILQGSVANVGGYGIMDIGTAGDFYFRKINAAGSFIWTTGGYTERMRIDANGNVIVNSAAVTTSATNGFLYIPSCAGTPTGVPTAYTGRTPMVYDSTNNKLYIYNGGWKSSTFA